MILYNVLINNGNENIGAEGQTITLQEQLTPAGNTEVARQITHQNSLIPISLSELMVEYTLKGILELLALGHVVQLKIGNNVMLRIWPDVKPVGGDNINLARAQEKDPTITEFTVENAGRIVDLFGVNLKVQAEVQVKLSEMLRDLKPEVCRDKVINRPKVTRTESNTTTVDTSTGTTVDTSTGSNSGGDDIPSGNG